MKNYFMKLSAIIFIITGCGSNSDSLFQQNYVISNDDDRNIYSNKDINKNCIPKTCEEFEIENNGQACGENIPDGCGGFIENCNKICDTSHNDFAECGQNIITTNGEIINGIQNICGGNCIKLPQFNARCNDSKLTNYNQYYLCTHYISGKSPNKSCYGTATGKDSTWEWCCKW